MKTTLFSVYLPTEDPRGFFIGTREEGGQGTTSGPKRGRGRDGTTAETRPMPRFRDPTGAARAALRAARAALRAARGPICYLSNFGSGFWKLAPGFDKTALQSQWLIMYAFNHQLNGDLGSSSSFHAMDLETCKRRIISRI